MTTYNWTGATDNSLNTTTNWEPNSPPVSPGFPIVDIVAFVDKAQRPALTSGRNLPSVRLDSSYNFGPILTLTPTGNTGFQGWENTTAPDGTGCCVYVAPDMILYPNNLSSSAPTFTYCRFDKLECKIYVDTNGEFRATFLGGGDANSYINKLGPGTLWLSYGGVASAPIATRGIQFTGGTTAIQAAAYPTGGIWGSSATLQFNAGSAILQVAAFAGSRTFANTLRFPSGATFDLGSGTTMNFSTTPVSGGTLTLLGAGTLAFTGATAFTLASSIAFSSSGTLTVPSGSTFAGAGGASISISSTGGGTGTINANGCTFGNNSAVNASTHTGTISGNCTILGGVSDFASVFTGAVTIGGGIITLRGASGGSVTSVGNSATLNVRNTISGGGGSSTTLNGGATLNFATSSGTFASNRGIDATAATTVGLSESASISSAINATDTTQITLQTTDNTTSTYSGTLTSNGASGTTRVMAFTGGTLVLSGSLTGTAGRTYDLNTVATHAGTIRVTGSGFSTSAVNLSRGTLQLNRAGSISLGGGLTANNGSTVACYSTGATYAAQLTGNLTLNAGSTMKFGVA